MRRLIPFLALALVAAGGSRGDGDSGDVSAANTAAAAAPKSAADLPSNLTPEQRATAEAGIGQQQAMADQMNKQGAAMKAAQAGAH